MRRVRIWPLGQPQKERATRARALDFVLRPHPQPRTRKKTSAIAKRRDQSRVPRRSPPPMATRRSLITRGGEKKSAPCHEPRSEARRRRRRRDTTKPTTHANDSPRRTAAASNGALIRLRQVENQSAPLPCLPFISRFTVPTENFIWLKIWGFVRNMASL